MAAVELTDVFRVYSTPEGDAAALQGLSLTVAEGDVVAVLGPSGSGKTTLLRLAAGLDRPSAGAVRVFGRDVGRMTARETGAYRASTIGYVDQHYSLALAPELSARELVGLQLGLAGEAREPSDRRAAELLDRVGLGDRLDAKPSELSGGEQQRVAVCAALAHRPRLLLADEPTGELDQANAATIFRLLSELAREFGCTVLIVTHDPAAAGVADRAVSIRDGRVSEEASARARTEESIVIGKGGWLRLPEDLLARAGIGTRARARLEGGAVVLSSAGPARAAGAGHSGSSEPAPAVLRPSELGAVLESVSKTFASRGVETRALVDVDATFAPGRLHAVTGPSGSGKTTLLQLVAGLDVPTQGTVRVLDTRLSELGRSERAEFRRRHVALVGQASRLIPFLSARENVELALAIRREQDGDHRVSAALDVVGLSERAGQRVGRLSAGEQVRVDVARAVAVRPALLLIDEPTARLDQSNAVRIADLLVEVAGHTGAVVVCATHDPIVIERADAELRLTRSSA